jgi:probable phosphoglycerate mutase
VAENRLTLVRHGETEWSRDGKHTGRTDIPLTDEGRVVAGKLAQVLRSQQFALVLTSPLARARDTAAIAGFPDAVVDEDLREWDYGDYEGRTTPEIRETDEPNWFLWDDGVPNGESLDEVAARADRVVARVQAVDGDVLVFAHGHFLRVLAARWLDCRPGFGRHLVLSPATVSILGWERNVPAVEAWNAPVS